MGQDLGQHGLPDLAGEGIMSERCRCAECVARDALLLLESGRASMALSLLRGLPEAIRDAVAAARAEGVREGRRRPQPAKTATVPSKPAPTPAPGAGRPGFRREAAELREHVERLGAERVAEVLRVGAAELEPLLEGRVSVAKAGLLRLRKAG